MNGKYGNYFLRSQYVVRGVHEWVIGGFEGNLSATSIGWLISYAFENILFIKENFINLFQLVYWEAGAGQVREAAARCAVRFSRKQEHSMILLEKYHSSLVHAADSRGGGGAGHNPGNFAQDHERAAEAGRKGGQHSHGGTAAHGSGNPEHKGGNFADDPERAAEAGRKGGQYSHGGHGSSAEHSTGSAEKKSGNFADDPEKAAEAGRKGGHASHKGS
ncbi:con-10 family general stress protein [Gluconacetobacter aggeris]|nr:KGG domain-containing protein [Gluconacetobacter aggeris]